MPKGTAQGLTKGRRLHRGRDFHLAFKMGRRINLKTASVVVLANDHGISRLGISVNKRIGNAITRNRIKRYIREAFRRTPELTSQSADFVFIVRDKRPHMDFSAVQGDMERLVSQL